MGKGKEGAFGGGALVNGFRPYGSAAWKERCGMRMVMTYCEHTGYGAVFRVLLRVEMCKIEGKFLLHIMPVGPTEGFPRKF